MASIEVHEKGVLVCGDGDQMAAWARAAGDTALAEWIAGVADDAATNSALERTWPCVVKLQHPIDHGSERITSLEFRRGRIGDLKGVKLGKELPTEDLVRLASKLCGQPVGVIDKLDIDDAGEVMDIALDFFAKCLATGQKRSL